MFLKKIKVRVIESFIDATTGKVRDINEEFNCSEKRYQEIEKKGHYVEKVEAVKQSDSEE